MSKKTRKFSFSSIIMIVLGVAAGFGVGILFGMYLDTLSQDTNFLLAFGLMMLSLYISLYLQIILHEAGHLIFGLMTGYEFVSFRIGSLMLIRADSKLRLKRFSLAGTGGQCLMSPPGNLGEHMPVMLYNFGGALVNLFTAAVCLALNVLLPASSFISVFLVTSAVIGLLFAVTNGVPMRGLVNNDGSNAMALRKDPAARRSLWIQLKGNAMQAQGVRTQDMPQEWFVLPSDEAMRNSMIAPLGPLCSDRLMAEHRFADAAQLQDQLLSGDNAIVPVHRLLLTCDRIYCELVGPNDPEALARLLTKDHKKSVAALKTLLGPMRTAYAQALLMDKDEAKAAKLLEQFNKRVKFYPYAAEVEQELSLIALAGEIHKQRVAAGASL